MMNIKLLGEGDLDPGTSEFQHLNDFCLQNQLQITLEYREGQYWLHSDDEKEKPISVMIDRELKRHEDYFKRSSLYKENLAKAVGVKSGIRPKTLDLTGGLLGDSLMFLCFGCEVVTLERHPVIAFLIKSALKNAQHPLLKNLSYRETNAADYLAQNPPVEMIYFDPMFEDANEKALPKKEMRIFRSYVGSDQDAREVFKLACKAAGVKRVIVKRPRLSVPIGEKADLVFEGKATRYDVYFPQNHGTFDANNLK